MYRQSFHYIHMSQSECRRKYINPGFPGRTYYPVARDHRLGCSWTPWICTIQVHPSWKLQVDWICSGLAGGGWVPWLKGSRSLLPTIPHGLGSVLACSLLLLHPLPWTGSLSGTVTLNISQINQSGTGSMYMYCTVVKHVLFSRDCHTTAHKYSFSLPQWMTVQKNVALVGQSHGLQR